MEPGGMSRAIATAGDFRARARARLPHFLFEYYDGAAFAGETARLNEAAFGDVRLPQNVLRDMSCVNISTTIMGQALSLPLALSPVGLAGSARKRGEALAARAAISRGVGFTLSTTSVCRAEEVAGVAAPWFQLYMLRDRALAGRLLKTASALGCDTLVVTVDVPVLGRRWRDTYSGLGAAGPAGLVRRSAQMIRRPRWLLETGVRGGPHNLGTIARLLGDDALPLSACMAFMDANLAPGVDRECLEWLRRQWRGNLVVKGVLQPQDACVAIDCGADALIVSNHGGRQLDGVDATAHALPHVARAVGGKVPLLVDGGIRTGLDILRALALGADAAMVGRPWVFALATDGERGVARMIDLMAEELRIAMILTGCRDIAEVRALSATGNSRPAPRQSEWCDAGQV
ncbi:L-lactate dehydrogenase [Novosphingobium sp. HR1a]|uniref:L-lactate dehydrogenase n=1 Tax=Novosphingobium TaxID=165696 RepID=UPI00281185D2|nr:L-lactate dehydrogenase [Novosphingobium sp. HR1a]